MTLSPSTFQYLTPSREQFDQMAVARDAATIYAAVLEDVLPEGPDKTYTLRKFREVSMWVNICITRQPDGAPRIEPFNPSSAA